MKIAYITSARIPSERAYAFAISKLCEEWGKQGHDVTLIVPGKKYGSQEDVYPHYGLSHVFKIEKLRASDFLGEKPTASKLLYALDLLSYIVSLKMKRRDSETILYTREYILALLLPRKNLFLELHTVPMNRFLLKLALNRVRGIVAISSGVRDELIKTGVSTEKVVVAHDGVDLSVFAHAAAERSGWTQFGVDPRKKIVLYTGHFYEWKGADTLAEAAKLLPQDVQTVLIGGVDKELEDFKAKYAASNIFILPHQPATTIPRLLKSADVLVIPNSAKADISRIHASPLKLFEYMASGVPIVASDVASLREVLAEETAFFFEADNPRDLALAIEEALRNNYAAAAKAKHAGEKVKLYTWTDRALRILSFIAVKK